MEFPSTKELRLLHDNVCKSLGDPTRIHILYYLNEKPCNVSALAEAMDVPQPTISRHLSILRQSSLVKAERSGQMVVYHLVDQRIIHILESMRMILRETLQRQSSALLKKGKKIPA